MAQLPPLPPGETPCIHVQTPQGQGAPLTAEQLKALARSGQISPDTMIWFTGLSGWVRAWDHPDLVPLQAKAPASKPAELSPDDKNDQIFGQLVKDSWAYFKEHEQASQIDEVLVGAIITTAVETGYSLIDINSDGTNHYLRFENIQGDHSRAVFRLAHLTPGLTAAKVLGQRMSVVVGYGERMADFSRIWQALKAEYKSGYIQNPEPGTITVDGDMASGYVYVQVDLYLDVKNYIAQDYTINYQRLNLDIGATMNALRKYLRGRFGR